MVILKLLSQILSLHLITVCCSVGVLRIHLGHPLLTAKPMAHHAMNLLAKPTVRHHQTKHSIQAFEQNFVADFEHHQRSRSFWDGQCTFSRAQLLQVPNQSLFVHAELSPPMDHIRRMV